MKENVESVLQLLKLLQPILLKKAISVLCNNKSDIPYLTDSEIMDMFTNNKMVCFWLSFYGEHVLKYVIQVNLTDTSRSERRFTKCTTSYY